MATTGIIVTEGMTADIRARTAAEAAATATTTDPGMVADTRAATAEMGTRARTGRTETRAAGRIRGFSRKKKKSSIAFYRKKMSYEINFVLVIDIIYAEKIRSFFIQSIYFSLYAAFFSDS